MITQLHQAPDTIEFTTVMQVISQFYNYTPAGFSNGTLLNAAGSNEGSCKIFHFAQLHKLSESKTLHLFGRYYRDDVLGNPTGGDHANIRHFILTGWSEINLMV
ncbi:MAG: hypothetical protein ACI8XG_002308 [Congregibacter sp.]